MKKILLIIVTVFILLVYSVYKFISPQSKTDLGNGYNYSSEADGWQQYITHEQNYVVPEKVVYFDYDDNFIIAKRIVINLYRCCNKSVAECKGKNIISFNSIYLKKLEYWLVNKKENLAYTSLNKRKIELKLQDFNSKLKFNNKTYIDDTAMIIGSSENPSDKMCIIENNPSKNIKIIDLDNQLSPSTLHETNQ